jgi:E3 ubiquitin-protein ligase UBR4
VERKLSLVEGAAVAVAQPPGAGERAGRACYGCASACVEHCVTLLKALASRRAARVHLHQQGLVQELLSHNLRRGTAATRSSIQVLHCSAPHDSPDSDQYLIK